MPAVIRRTMDATFLNEVASHPEVRPWLSPDGRELDLTNDISNPANIALEAKGGGWVLRALLPGVYELHTLFLPSARGRAYFAAAWEAVRYVFTRTDALEIVTKCPDSNGGARMAAATMGFRERFRREDAWAPGVGVSYQAFNLDDWFVRDPECLKAGERFHVELKAAEVAAGVTLPDHPEDATHDRAAGAAALMIGAGQMAKALGFYNRWATLAGYPGIAGIGHNVIDMHEAVVEVRDGSMNVLLWRPPAA